MDALPSSIETYLQEAGFSGTELVVLNKLLQEDALTLRELAAKTGKSTGVLDQAVKKLIKKRILSREMINETPKYVLQSLQSIVHWMEDDIALKQEMLKRRHENFETFVRSLTVGKKRPEMEYFEGREGIKKAYIQLLDRGNDIVQYGPTNFSAPEDPLREFWVQYFRERRNRGIFARVITHNTPLGRKYQSRDPFEYRKTILVDQDAYPFTFEKIVIGDTVACFQLEDERACFIKYPELAQNERHFFERIWNKKISNEQNDAAEQEAYRQSVQPEKASVPFQTKTLSQLREFFLGKKSLATFAVFGLVAAAMTYGLYQQNLSASANRIRDRVLSIAATGALQFDPEDLAELRTTNDIEKPEYKKVIYQMNEIRRQNPSVRYVYIIRPTTSNPEEWEFVADADSLDPYAKIDLNNDGVVDEADRLSPPGDPYGPIIGDPSMYDAYTTKKPSANKEPYTDAWGTFISGSGPIIQNGEVIAILGVDINADRVETLTQGTFAPIAWFIGLFILFVIIRLAAFNRSLFQELWEIFQVKRMLITTISTALIALLATGGLYAYNLRLSKEQIRERVTSIAATAAIQFSAEDLEEIQGMEDVSKPIYNRLTTKLDTIRSQNKEIVYAYIIRPTRDKNIYNFVVDADAIDPFATPDTNDDGKVDVADTLGLPGLPYDVSNKDALINGVPSSPIANTDSYTDAWGTFYTGYAPIKDKTGKTVALMSIDMWGDSVFKIANKSFTPIYAFLLFFGLLFLFRLSSLKHSLLHTTVRTIAKKKVLYTLCFIAMGVYWALFGLHFYINHIELKEDGKRLMAIATTAAPTINGDDLDGLRKAGDMKKPEYQRIWKQLNDIRDRNGDITYVYIMRNTNQPDIYEFVVDADSNYFVPFQGIDYTQDNIIDDSDENVAPGVRYYWPDFEEKRWIKPYASVKFEKDQWGVFLSGSAPIKNTSGKTVAILGIEMGRIK